MALNPPLKGVQYIFYVGLVSRSSTSTFQNNPTLAAGDVKVSKDGGALANLNTLPTAVASGKLVKVTLSTTEMTADTATVIFSDVSGAEWCDLVIDIHPVDGAVPADVTKWSGTAVATPDTAGYPKVTIKNGTGAGELSTASGRAKADVAYWNAAAVAAPDTAGYPKVTIKNGTGAGELSTASGLAKADVAYWNAAAVAAPDTAGHPKVTVKNGTGAGELSTASGKVGVSGTVSADLVSVNGDPNGAVKLMRSLQGSVIGQVASGSPSPTSTAFKSDLTEATTDHYKGKLVLWATGALAGQVKAVTAYNGTTKVITVEQMTESPAVGDIFVML